MAKQLFAMLLLMLAATSSWPAAAIIGRLGLGVLQQPLPPPAMTLPDCPDKCGDVRIPYPFGTKAGCFLPGFEIVCNDTFRPPRPFLANPNLDMSKPMASIWDNCESYPGNPGCSDKQEIYMAPLPVGAKLVELIDVVTTVQEQWRARVYAPFSFSCVPAGGERVYWNRMQLIDVSASSPFVLSETGNVFIAIGRAVKADLAGAWPTSAYGNDGDNGPNGRGYVTTCSSTVNQLAPPLTDGSPCAGVGCCSIKITPRLRCSRAMLQDQDDSAGTRRRSPCSYAMVVQNSWYNFTVGDINDDGFLRRNIERGVPVVLDFAIRNNGECPPGGTPLPAACRSDNSECANASTIGGFICKCKQHYHGNPYIPGGCQDIDECTQPDVYNCSSNGICKNRLEGYDCPCKPWMKGDGKNGTCTDIFPLPAKVAVGAIGFLLGTAVVVFVVLLLKEKRKMRDFFVKNGGPILQEVKNIKIFKKEELKPILKKSNIIGQGCFGEVYKGHLENQLVAVKKPINIDVAEKEQFANEVIIQSRIIHKNIVKLIGCCLEVDIPMLVYEFVSKGSLHDILHGSKRVPLDLNMRLCIAAESAEGLAYMHSKTTSTILHGDVKPANILLDDNFVPKISDFGISKLIAKDKEQHTNNVIGDKSYMDPVYLQTGLLTKKSDVYSFGIVLLELISRTKATYSDNNSLVLGFLDAHKNRRRASELFDDEIAITGDLEDIDNIVEIAVNCLNLDVHQRPEMTDVAERLLTLKRKRNN